MNSADDQTGLLSGVTVVDLTRVVSGPSCTRQLADLGATVLKIEPPEGDMWRAGRPTQGGLSVAFSQLNAGKKFLCIDLKTDAGQDIVFRLASQADVFVENFRPRVAKRLGLAFDALHSVNPKLIYCSISGYGQTGPAVNKRAYAPIIHAELGLLALNARERNTEPMPESASHVDFSVGMQASIGILAALYQRSITGVGQHIDASMAETMLAANEATAIEVNGGFGDQFTPYRPGKAAVVQLANGSWVQLPGNPISMVFRIAKALGKEAELQQLGWQEPQQLLGQEPAVLARLRRWAAEFTDAAALETALDSIRVPVGEIKELSSTINEDWAIERGAFTEVQAGPATTWVPTSPLRTGAGFIGPRQGAAGQGSHNQEILQQLLGLTTEQIDQLRAQGVLIEKPAP